MRLGLRSHGLELSVKESVEAMVAEPTVQLHRRKSVVAGVAQKNVKSLVGSHLGSLIAAV